MMQQKVDHERPDVFRRSIDYVSRSLEEFQLPGRSCVRCWRSLEPNPVRKIDVYSDSIGVVLDTVEGADGSYALKPEDLDVRAKTVDVGQDLKPDWQSSPAAWSQPYR